MEFPVGILYINTKPKNVNLDMTVFLGLN